MSVSKFLQIISILTISSSLVLSTKTICPVTENYTVTSMETYTEPVVVNTFTWCLQVPPRCPKTRIEMRQRYRIKTEVRTRSVNECCEGYKMEKPDNSEADIKCVPFCENCLAGLCVSPNQCQCDPGFRGHDCGSACPEGTWGWKCENKCDCDQNIPCSPVFGYCVCPPGFHGRSCDEKCPDDRWGPGCMFSCDCEDSLNACHSETGNCTGSHVSTEKPTSYVRLETTTNVSTYETSNTVMEHNVDSSKIFGTTRQTEAERTNITSDNITISTTTTFATTNPGGTFVTNTDDIPTMTQIREKVTTSSTTRPVIVLVSVPERRRNLDKDRAKFSIKNPFLRHVNGDVDSHGSASLKTDYVKTVHKEDVQTTPIPLDIALIVVASIVSLGLTSVAVAMVLHMRSKLFETVRVAIYDDNDKTKSQDRENTAGGRISTFVTGTLPQSPIRVSPVFTSSPEPSTILTVDGIESLNGYANGAATIGLRISGNLRDFLQDGHYDRPQATLTQLQNEFDATTEHVYDEIPLQSSPGCAQKNA